MTDPLLPVEEAAQRLNVSVETVLRYARRNKWRKLKGNDGVLVAVPPDMLGRPGKSLQEPPPPAPLASAPGATGRKRMPAGTEGGARSLAATSAAV